MLEFALDVEEDGAVAAVRTGTEVAGGATAGAFGVVFPEVFGAARCA